jgi:hypothetical protein
MYRLSKSRIDFDMTFDAPAITSEVRERAQWWARTDEIVILGMNLVRSRRPEGFFPAIGSSASARSDVRAVQVANQF